ncbi:MAG: hypothetical protein ABI047_10780, partial [Jatrophihabitantaceae bacterium]
MSESQLAYTGGLTGPQTVVSGDRIEKRLSVPFDQRTEKFARTWYFVQVLGETVRQPVRLEAKVAEPELTGVELVSTAVVSVP